MLRVAQLPRCLEGTETNACADDDEDDDAPVRARHTKHNALFLVEDSLMEGRPVVLVFDVMVTDGRRLRFDGEEDGGARVISDFVLSKKKRIEERHRSSRVPRGCQL